ncbi:MAG: hypothetical protein WKG00_04715 [Polyangiaceae bacterium]
MNLHAWACAGVVAAIAALASCSDDGDDDTDTPAASGSGTSSSTASGAGGAGATSGEGGGASGGAGAAASGGVGGGAGGTGGTGGSPALTCDEIDSAYQSAIAGAKTCNTAGGCQVLQGHCGIGLGGCYEAVNSSLTQSDLDKLAAEWSAQGCLGPVCKCAPPPLTVGCDQGMCALPP